LGGAGKTPTAIAVARLLAAAGERPMLLSRGYGGRLEGPRMVDPRVHRARDVGEEPLLLAEAAPTFVARDRLAGARAARDAGASVIVMDDGFQNPALAKDLSILVVDARRGVGNGRVFPAGPLRAPLAPQLDRAHALLAIGMGAAADPVVEQAQARGLATFHARLEPHGNAIAALKGRQVLAFAGIGDPEKFFTTLAEAGLDVPVRRSFGDHHRYGAYDAAALMAQADRYGLTLVTTEKDLLRFRGDPSVGSLSARARALPVTLVIDEAESFRGWLLDRLGKSLQAVRSG
jgi:tetraacyldisaccharide 4'-kinase